ncbi:MAG TPA: TMEM175 family protein [Chloroflexota bacterium]|jgi:uncharacterized membrane protein
MPRRLSAGQRTASGGPVDVERAAASELERLIFLSDGVFAIAMTLLAIDLALPEVTSESAADLGQRLLALGPRFFSFALSFLVIASYWRSHLRVFRYVVRLDGRFVWLNLVLLLGIAFLPFPTSVLGNYGDDSVSVSLYAGTLAAIGFVVLAMWLYATTGRRLVTHEVSSREIQHTMVRAVAVPAIFLLSIGIAQLDPNAAKYSWVAIAFATIAVDRYFKIAT